MINMIDRIILKLRSMLEYLIHLKIYNKKVILLGVPKILYGNRITFGNKVRINDNVFLHAVNGIKIGDNTTLSYGSMIITESYDLTNEKKYLERKHRGAAISIGKNVWICAGVIILPGVTIADNIIVAAGSVVTKDLTIEKGLYAGNPAKFVKKWGI